MFRKRIGGRSVLVRSAHSGVHSWGCTPRWGLGPQRGGRQGRQEPPSLWPGGSGHGRLGAGTRGPTPWESCFTARRNGAHLLHLNVKYLSIGNYLYFFFQMSLLDWKALIHTGLQFNSLDIIWCDFSTQEIRKFFFSSIKTRVSFLIDDRDYHDSFSLHFIISVVISCIDGERWWCSFELIFWASL